MHLNEINPNNALLIAQYQTKYTDKTKTLLVALCIIVILNVVLTVLSHQGHINHNFTYIGASASVTFALIAFGILFFGRKNNLREAFENAQSLETIRQILKLTQRRMPFFSYTNCIGTTNEAELFSYHIYGTLKSRDLTGKSSQFIENEQIANYLRPISEDLNSGNFIN